MRPLAAVCFLLVSCTGGRAPSGPAVTASVRPPSASARWWNGAVVYQVFVRSFQDSDGDGRGDLRGLLQRLDYLNDGDPSSTTSLGVDALWLMPIHPSPSTHGYDVTDYDGVNPEYGTSADLDELLAAAHRRGLRVLLDFVPNHTSRQHPWFQEADASAASPRRDWYVWSATPLSWTQPWGGPTTWHPGATGWYYGLFSAGMPDLNWRNAAVREELGAAAVRWLVRRPEGVDGFRLDAVRYLVENGPGRQQDQPETHAALRELSARLRSANPDVALLGEAWADAATVASYFGSTPSAPEGEELPLALDFPIAEALVRGLAAGADGASVVGVALDRSASLYPPGTGGAPFLTNHDQTRLATAVGGAPSRLRLAATILLTLQGTPVVYYGEELGMANGPCAADECKRTPMAWDATPGGGFTTGTPWWPPAPGGSLANVASQLADPGSLLSRYRALLKLRRSSPALARGGTVRLAAEDAGLLCYLRTAPSETVLVAHNLGSGSARRQLSAPGAVADPLLLDPGASLAASAAGWTISLPGGGSGIWRLR